MTTFPLVSILFFSTFFSLVLGLPVFSTKGSTVSALSAIEVAKFTPYIHYAGAGYCKPATTKNWSCGGSLISLLHRLGAQSILANCKAMTEFQTTASGGNGFFFFFFF